jgi:hypothetical protein
MNIKYPKISTSMLAKEAIWAAKECKFAPTRVFAEPPDSETLGFFSDWSVFKDNEGIWALCGKLADHYYVTIHGERSAVFEESMDTSAESLRRIDVELFPEMEGMT